VRYPLQLARSSSFKQQLYLVMFRVCCQFTPPPPSAVSPRHKKVQNVTNFCLWCDTIQQLLYYSTPPHGSKHAKVKGDHWLSLHLQQVVCVCFILVSRLEYYNIHNATSKQVSGSDQLAAFFLLNVYIRVSYVVEISMYILYCTIYTIFLQRITVDKFI
jgi:hypothetical protein